MRSIQSIEGTQTADRPKFLRFSHKANKTLNRESRQARPYLVDVMSAKQKAYCTVLSFLWLVAGALFWTWWIHDLHIVSWPRFLVNSGILAWVTMLPGYYFFFLSRMKRSNPDLPLPQDVRVAMVVTKAPSEPFALVRETLEAMLAQTYPHDTWLADEDPQPEAVAWCAAHSVLISTRKGLTAYHRATWPRRTRCKEGNLAYFYDTYGYAQYDVVMQLDADHRPGRGYLETMLRPFANPIVGYTSAPSMCDVNAEKSWAARARLYGESTLHGSLQAGYNAGWAPLCIGSHYAVRTAALREVGGLGPELAEDHSTTLMLNAQGWKGVHAFDAEAHGDGPVSFADCMTQEFQWSRSLTVLLLTLTPRYWGALPAKLRFQFLFAQLWYPCFGSVMLIGFLLPILALLTGTSWVHVSYVAFCFYKFPLTAVALIVIHWVKRNGWLRPHNSRIMTWETVLFQLARWPWILLGSTTAVIDVVTRRQFDFRITPKGGNRRRPLAVRVLIPYIVLAISSGLVASLTSEPGDAGGYFYLALVNSLIYTVVVWAVVLLHLLEQPGISTDVSWLTQHSDRRIPW